MSILKKLMACTIALGILLFTPLTGSASSVNFQDLKSVPWAKDEIIYLANQGIINGYSDTVFGPKDFVTRGQAVHILMKAIQNHETYDGDPIFSDVDLSKYYAHSIHIANQLGIVKGYTDGRFQPDKPVSRSETATLINQAFAIQKGNRPVNFTDSLGWAKEQIINLASNGIISGFNDGTFRPQQFISRAEFASIVARSINKEFIPPMLTDIESDKGLHPFEKEVFKLTNRERTKHGVPPLKHNQELSKIARIKSQDMKNNNYFNHHSPIYGSPFDMIRSFGIDYKMAAENIAVGYSTPDSVVNGWMNSPGHRSNILNPSLKEIGIGFVKDGLYWTQMFITQWE